MEAEIASSSAEGLGVMHAFGISPEQFNASLQESEQLRGYYLYPAAAKSIAL